MIWVGVRGMGGRGMGATPGTPVASRGRRRRNQMMMMKRKMLINNKFLVYTSPLKVFPLNPLSLPM